MKSNIFRQIIRDYFIFNKTERRGFSVFGILIIIVAILHFLTDRIDFIKPADFSEAKQLLSEIEKLNQLEKSYRQFTLFTFDPNTITAHELDSIDLPRQVKNNVIRYRERGGQFRSASDFRKIYGMNDSIFERIEPYLSFAERQTYQIQTKQTENQAEPFFFNPNTASDEDLNRLGLNNFQRRNLLSYRSSGGTFKSGADLLKVYGIDEKLFQQLEPWIVIPESPYEEKRENMENLLSIDINQADSLKLLLLPGIGPVFSGRIVRFRQMLGGFYSVDQLKEVYGMTDERFVKLEPFLFVGTNELKIIRVNFAEWNELRTHPYISNDQAKMIIKLRSDKGPFASLDDLLENGVFDQANFKKVKPYLTCQ